jgi:zinc transport system permease protein
MLVSAMLILPPLTALQLSVSFRMTIIASVIFSILSVTGGIILSFLLNLPAGGTIVILNVIFLLIVFGIKKILPASR